MKYQKENQRVQGLAKQLLKEAHKDFGQILSINVKTGERDVVSRLDLLADNILVKGIKKAFPEDTIVSEESSPNANLGEGRAWALDPICGSMNVARGIKAFATNIALLENGKVVAAWVVDHMLERVIWSVGDRKLFSDKTKLRKLSTNKGFSLVGLDWGYWDSVSEKNKIAYANLHKDLLLNKNFSVLTFNTSLDFTYVATGQQQGKLTINVQPWDLLAPAFLVEQNGGVVTNFDGRFCL